MDEGRKVLLIKDIIRLRRPKKCSMLWNFPINVRPSQISNLTKIYIIKKDRPNSTLMLLYSSTSNSSCHKASRTNQTLSWTKGSSSSSSWTSRRITTLTTNLTSTNSLESWNCLSNLILWKLIRIKNTTQFKTHNKASWLRPRTLGKVGIFILKSLIWCQVSFKTSRWW